VVDILKNRLVLDVGKSRRGIAQKVPGSRYMGEGKWSFPIGHHWQVSRLFPDLADEVAKDFEQYHGRKQEQERLDFDKYKRAVEERGGLDIEKVISGVRLDQICKFRDDRKPFPHQIRLLKIMMAFPFFNLHCEMGSGKTFVGAHAMIYKPGVKRSLVAVPKSVMSSWADELDKIGFSDYNIIDGSKDKRIKLLESGCRICIINYEGILSIGENTVWKNFDLVILDESSRIKNHRAKSTKLILKIFRDTPNKYCFTGTPVTQGPSDLYPQLKFINRLQDYKSFYAYRNVYVEMGGYGGYKEVRYKNLHDLKSRLDCCSVSLKKEDCNINIPKLYQKRILKMSAEMEQQYMEMKRQMVLELEDEEYVTAKMVLTKLLRLQQIMGGHWIDTKNNNKLKELSDIVKEICIENERKLVVFTRFTESADQIARMLETMNVKYSRLDGSTKDRKLEIDRFQEGENQVFICQIDSGAYGITLHAASTVVYYENTFSLERRKQSEDRIHRIGQNESCLYIDMIYDKTIDADVLKAISGKQMVSRYLVDCFMAGVYTLKGKEVRREIKDGSVKVG